MQRCPPALAELVEGQTPACLKPKASRRRTSVINQAGNGTHLNIIGLALELRCFGVSICDQPDATEFGDLCLQFVAQHHGFRLKYCACNES